MDRRAFIIINPISGTTANKAELSDYITRRLTDAGWHVDMCATRGHGDATTLAAKAAADGYTSVIAVGGDGTINETAAALCDTPATLGIIPCGSGNGLARHLGIPLTPREAVDIILAGHVTAADYGSVNDRKFFCTFGVGFDAAVSELFARSKRRGRMSYIRSTFEEYVKFHPEVYTISANGHEITRKAFLVAVCNASQYGNNAYIAPEASITDGLLDIIIIHSGNVLQTALVGLDMMTGYLNRNTLIQTVRASSATITRTAVGPAHLDGEPVKMADSMHIACHSHGLNIHTPASSGHFRPIITPVCSAFNDMVTSLRGIFHIGNDAL